MYTDSRVIGQRGEIRLGGRGSLSSNNHKMYDVNSIRPYMNKKGIRVYGEDKITTRGLSTVVDLLENVNKLNRQQGFKNITTVMIGTGSSMHVKLNYNAKLKNGSSVDLGNTLVIPKSIATQGKKVITVKGKKSVIQINKNLNNQLTYEYGKTITSYFSSQHPDLYKSLTRKVTKMTNDSVSKVKVSDRNGGTANDHIHDSVALILRNKHSRSGSDLVELVADTLGTSKVSDFSRYGLKSRQSYKRGKSRK